ncbi:APC family permease [Pseudomonas moorei]|uniref:APC family permease n=1 Tax=Pseudomonas moorei TaxID=395599 RepID=UPI001FF6E53B|nr:APC family permease [Pseudomonas moorei]
MSNLNNLKRKLSLLDLTLIGLGATFGSGWLFASSHVAAIAGPAGIISWIIGASAVFLLGLMYCELGAAMPTTGGILQYPIISHGPMLGYMMGFITLVAYSSVVAIEVVAARQYASAWFPSLTEAGSSSPTMLGWMVQFCLLCLFMLTNYFSIKSFALANNIISLFKFIVPICVVVVLFRHFNSENLTQSGFAPNGVEGIGAAISAGGIIFAYLGLTPIISAASEVKNPQRNIPLALMLSIACSAVIYLLLQIAFLGSLPTEMLANGWSDLGSKLPLPFRDIALLLGAVWLATIVVADAVVSPTGCGNIFMNSTSRIACGWAASTTLLNGFAKVDPKSGIPRRALWLAFVLSVAWTLPFPSWEKLISVVSAALVLSYAIAPISVAALRRRNFSRPFKVKALFLLGPLSFFVASLLVLWSGWNVISWLAGLQILIFIVQLALKSVSGTGSTIHKEIRSSLWLVVYYAGMMGLTWASGPGKVSELTVISILAMFSTAIYFWGATSCYPLTEKTDSLAMPSGDFKPHTV